MQDDDTSEFIDLDAAPAAPAEEPKQSEAKAEQDAEQAPAGEGQEETEAEQPDGDEPDRDGEEGDEEAPKRKRPSGAERLKRQLERERAERERLERELSAMRAGSQKPAAGDESDAIKAIIGDPPREDEYPDYLAYERALTAYEVDKRQATRAVREQAARQDSERRSQAEEAYEDFRDRIAETKKHLPDYDKVLSETTVSIDAHVGQLIVESEKGPQVAYHLAKNPDFAERLNRMSATRAAMEIGRLEARLSLPKPKTTTNAPPPLDTPRGGSTPSRSPDQMPMDDFAKWLVKKVG